jgi:hypothetical protein
MICENKMANLFYPTSLPWLWMACAATAAIFLAPHFFSCESPALLAPPPAPSVSETRPRLAPSYTFVEATNATPAEAKETKAVVAGDSAMSASTASPARAGSGLAVRRHQPVTAATGAIPDLDIDLANHDIMRVMARYGYVPAVKTRTRLLGRISGQSFLPLSVEESARYARRGRSGAQYPQAETWRQRVAAELDIPIAEIQVIFLVPQATESLFVQAQLQALAAAGKSAGETALMRAHFDANLEVIVDELVMRTGEIVAVGMEREQ